MSYVQQNLIPSERVLYETRLHWIVLLRSILTDIVLTFTAFWLFFIAMNSTTGHTESQAALVVGMIILIAGNFLLALAAVRRNATEMAVTNKRVIIKVGFLSKRTIELFLSKVESVEVNQSMLGGLLGFGSIVVRGTGGTNEPFGHVANPLEFRRQVQHQIEEYSRPSQS
jgi:uncharacterized membrane protein YdbT with pleckstrin-like domain